jgi:hypothetical protein
MGQSDIWPTEEDETPEQDLAQRLAEETPLPERPEPAPYQMPGPSSYMPLDRVERADDESEESIEDYMSRLLQRVGGTSSGIDIHEIKDELREPGVADSTEASTPPSETGSLEGDVDRAELFSPRRLAPELSADMAAMRAVANDTARSAIAVHAGRNCTSQARARMLVCFVALVLVAIGTLMFANQPFVLILGTTLGAIILSFVGWESWSLRKRLLASLTLEIPRPDGDEPSSDASIPPENEPEADAPAATIAREDEALPNSPFTGLAQEDDTWNLEQSLDDGGETNLRS